MIDGPQLVVPVLVAVQAQVVVCLTVQREDLKVKAKAAAGRTHVDGHG
jgi:hypothetical protein